MSDVNRVVRLVLLVLGLSVGCAAWAQEKAPPIASPLKITANDCKSCHTRAYREWEQSYHSKSVVSMLAGFERYITTQEQAKGRPLNREELMGCMGCHAPAMRFADDAEFTKLANLVKTDQRDALAGLSIDCVACHALHGSGYPETKPAEILGDLVLHGTVQNPLRTVHGTQLNATMGTSEFCKGCHTYVTAAEMKVHADWDILCSLTYDAWATGPHGPNAPAGNRKDCQGCHMEKLDGKAADVPGMQIPSRKVSSHLFPGWHSADLMQRTAELSLASKAGAGAGTLELTVNIDNKGGHRFPDT